MADNRKNNASRFEQWEDDDFDPKDVSEPIETDYDAHMLDVDDFEAPDVSVPRAPRKEMEIIGEALAIRRSEWFKAHMLYIFAAIGIVIVGLTFLGIRLFYQNTNPISRLSAGVAKDFNSSFAFDVVMTEKGEPVMSYNGAIRLNNSKHELEALYQADYNRYTYTGAVYVDRDFSMEGSLYEGKWLAKDCSDRVQSFFDFDRSLHSGSFNGGAFLRFMGLTSDYSTREMEAFASVIKERLSTNSTIATITVSAVGDATRYDYVIDLPELFEMIKDSGASVFYRASDYNKFIADYELNKHILESASCGMSFEIDDAGYLTLFEVNVKDAEGTDFGLSCKMSDFGSASVEVPEGFLKAAAIESAKEKQ